MDYCNNISVIPQFGGTCWFNAILMACFYSQEMRRLMINKISKTWNSKLSLYKFMKTILKYSYDTEEKKIVKLFNKIKPEELLFQILQRYDRVLLKHLINKLNIGWYPSYISLLLKYLNVNVLDITNLSEQDNLLNYYNVYNVYNKNFYEKITDTEYEDKLKEIEKSIETPDVIIFKRYLELNLNLIIDTYTGLITQDSNYEVYKSFKYELNGKDFKDMYEFKDEINFRGHKYKLDSVLLISNNGVEIKLSHAIAGISCNNKKYVYNGWKLDTTDPAMKIQGGNNEACKLIKYDWNLKIDDEFCLNPKECSLDKITNKEDLCFNFSKGDVVLVYVKIEEEETERINSSSFKSFSQKSKDDLREFFLEEIEKLTREEIINKLRYKYVLLTSFSFKILQEIILQDYLSKYLENIASGDIEYFTKISIANFKPDELLIIDDKYYLKKILFYEIFIQLKNVISLSNEKLREIFFYYFDNNDIISILKTYLINININMNFITKIKNDFLKQFITLNKLGIISKIIKTFEEDLISLYLTDKKMSITELIEYLKKNNKNPIFYIKFNKLYPDFNIKNIDDVIDYLKKIFMISGGKNRKTLKKYKK